MKNNKNSLKGNSVIRSELLLRLFFNEFFRIRENSKIFLKLLTKERVLNKKNKESIVELYFIVFDKIYEIRNLFVHQNLGFKDFDVDFGENIFELFDENEREKFIKLINQANTRENTIEMQCALYIKLIKTVMNNYVEFQEKLNSYLADLIILYEEKVIKITVTKNI